MNINSTLEMFMGAVPKMEVYWEFTRKGQKLVLDWDGKKEMIGGVRETKSGFDAFAKTFSMTPERAQKGIPQNIWPDFCWGLPPRFDDFFQSFLTF